MSSHLGSPERVLAAQGGDPYAGLASRTKLDVPRPSESSPSPPGDITVQSPGARGEPEALGPC